LWSPSFLHKATILELATYKEIRAGYQLKIMLDALTGMKQSYKDHSYDTSLNHARPWCTLKTQYHNG